MVASPFESKKKGGAAAGKVGNTFSQKRKSAENMSEKYSPIKEAKDENSLEEDKAGGEDDDDDDDYTSVDNSSSTLKHKYSNQLGLAGSGQKGGR